MRGGQWFGVAFLALVVSLLIAWCPSLASASSAATEDNSGGEVVLSGKQDELEPGFHEQDGEYSYVSPLTGERLTGSFVLFDEQGERHVIVSDSQGRIETRTGWLVMFPEGHRKLYYFRDDLQQLTGMPIASVQTGLQEIEGRLYYADQSDGSMRTGLIRTGNGLLYAYSGGAILSEGIQEVTDEAGWHRFIVGSDHYLRTGIVEVNGSRYYCSPETGEMRFGEFEAEGRKFRTNEDGSLASGLSWEGNTIAVYDRGMRVNIRDRVLDAVSEIGYENGLFSNFPMRDTGSLWNAINSMQYRGWQVGFVMVDLASGRTVSYHGSDVFYTASTIKSSYCAYVMDVLVDGGRIPFGAVSGLVAPTVRDSNNDTYSTLRLRYGNAGFAEWLGQVGEGSVASRFYPHINVAQFAKIWGLNADYLLSGRGSSVWLRSQQLHSYNSSIDQAIGNSDVFTKAGWIASGSLRALNDGGVILDFHGTPVLLCIMSTAGPGNNAYLRSLVNSLGDVL